MSFGFSVGDFLTVGELAWRLYRDCYKIARGAPQEFQLLVGEISTLSNSLTILQEEVKDPDSALVRAGDDRIRMVNEMVQSICVTLRSLEKMAKKYEILGSNSKRKHLWAKFKWSVEFTSIDGLRNKLVYHNTVMNLLLTSVGNSSLQRIESSTDALEHDIRQIKSYITGQKITEVPLIPTISTLDDDSETLILSASLMQNAEVLQPWSTIGVDQWIECGRWWLVRSQMELHSVLEPGQEVPLAPYTSLVKASWILIDIIACHPQVPFLSASTHSEVQILSARLKTEFQRLHKLEAVIPDLRNIESKDLRIWEAKTRGIMLRPSEIVEGGEQVLFQSFTMLKMQALPDPIPCILLFLTNNQTNEARLSAQNQNGTVVMAVSFEKELKVTELDGCDVMLNNEQITLASTQDCQMLCSLVEGANFYCLEALKLGGSIDDLEAYALMFAVKAQRREAASRLLEKLPLAAANGDRAIENASTVASNLACDMAKGLLNETLCHDNKTPRSQLPLFQWAIECNHISLATLIISNQVTSSEGESWRKLNPLSLACWCGHNEIARQLLHDADKKGPNGQWPLHAAARNGHTKIARLLLRNGAGVDPRDDGQSMTPLSIAARYGHERTVELLIDKGANIENKSARKYTPLHEACEAKQEGVIALLAEEGSDFTSPYFDGTTPYHLVLDRALSKPIFELAASKYFEKRNRTPNIPQATGKVVWEIDSDWAMLWLDSPGAYFVHPDPLPGNVRETHGHLIEVRQPMGTTHQFFKWTYECDIVYSTTSLFFSAGHGTLGTTRQRGNTTLKIRASGEPDAVSESIRTSPTGHPSNFRSYPEMKIASLATETCIGGS